MLLFIQYSWSLKKEMQRLNAFSFAFLTFFTLVPSILEAQCSGGTSGGALTPAPSSSFQTMAVTSGNYYTFTVPSGCIPTYVFSFCSADGGSAAFDSQITILDNTGAYAGGYNDDNCGLQSYVSWTPTVSGTYRVLINTYSCSTGGTGTLAYRSTTPPNMTYASSTTTQASTATVTKCDIDQEIIGIQITTTGTCSPLTLTQFQLGAGSSTSSTLADVSKIHIYYTGTSSTFSTSSEFVSGGTTVTGGTHTISGSQTLANGTNYFWVAYDIKSTATTSNVVDASCTSVTIAGSSYTPSTTSPTGTRTINVCAAYPGTSALGLKHWVKSDAGVTLTGGAVSAWADQSGAAITGNMGQSTAANRPAVVSSVVNFQDYIRFDGSNDLLVSANSFNGGTLFHSTDNTIFMIKNYKSGLVDYKWETDPTNSYRIGFELNGSAQRIDFVDDNGGGRNNISTTAITNKDVMVEYVSDATKLSLLLNGNSDAVITHPSLTFVPGTSISKPLYIGANDLGNPLYCNIDIAEVLTYNKKLTGADLRRVESYLAIKYGITLGNNKGTGAEMMLMASDGTQIWNSKTGYHNFVIGIGRDNASGASGLNKLKSTSVASLNGSTDIVTIANGTSLSSPSSFTSNNSFFISGSNALTLASTTTSILDLPSGIARRLERVWLGQETGTVGTVRIQFNMSTVPGVGGVAGANDLANVRLLVDANGVFATGATVISPSTFNNTTDLVEFQVDFTSGSGFYYTIGSTDAINTPLPVELISYEVKCVDNTAKITWTTASETNNDFFTVSRAGADMMFYPMSNIQGAYYSSTTHTYAYTDGAPLTGTSYYKLSQTDMDGSSVDLGVQPLNCENAIYVDAYYSANDLGFVINNNSVDGSMSVDVYDGSGRSVYSKKQVKESRIVVGPPNGGLASGIYFIHVILNEKRSVFKIAVP